MLHFPRMVHKPDGRLVVNTQVDYDAALSDGWVASRADLFAPAPVDDPSVEPPKRRGRPRKTEG